VTTGSDGSGSDPPHEFRLPRSQQGRVPPSHERTASIFKQSWMRPCYPSHAHKFAHLSPYEQLIDLGITFTPNTKSDNPLNVVILSHH
jgi:hypothetical protein